MYEIILIGNFQYLYKEVLKIMGSIMKKFVSVNKIKTRIIYIEEYKMNFLNLDRANISKISQIKGLHNIKSLNLDLSFNKLLKLKI